MCKEYKCKRCGYETEYRHSMQSHLRKKNACKIKFDHESREDLLKELDKKKKHKCINCDQTYDLLSNLNRHVKECNKRKLELESLSRERAILETSNETDYDLIITNLNVFGNVTKIKLDNDKLKEIIAMEDKMYAEAIREIHFNDDYPENWNILLNDITSDSLEVYDNNKFVCRNIEETIDNIIIYTKKYLISELNERKNELCNNEKEYDRYKINIEFYGNVMEHTKNEKYERVNAIKRVAYIYCKKIEPLKQYNI